MKSSEIIRIYMNALKIYKGKEFAEKIEISNSLISDYLTDKKCITANTALKMKEAINANPDFLLGKTSDPEKMFLQPDVQTHSFKNIEQLSAFYESEIKRLMASEKSQKEKDTLQAHIHALAALHNTDPEDIELIYRLLSDPDKAPAFKMMMKSLKGMIDE